MSQSVAFNYKHVEYATEVMTSHPQVWSYACEFFEGHDDMWQEIIHCLMQYEDLYGREAIGNFDQSFVGLFTSPADFSKHWIDQNLDIHWSIIDYIDYEAYFWDTLSTDFTITKDGFVFQNI
jgi:hypothetical protein